MSIKGINFGLLTRRGGYRISSGNSRRGSRKYTQRIAAHCCIRWFIRGITSEPDSNTLIGFKLYLLLKRLATVLFVKIEINSIIPMGILRL